jgi:hypothetical protein
MDRAPVSPFGPADTEFGLGTVPAWSPRHHAPDRAFFVDSTALAFEPNFLFGGFASTCHSPERRRPNGQTHARLPVQAPPSGTVAVLERQFIG